MAPSPREHIYGASPVCQDCPVSSVLSARPRDAPRLGDPGKALSPSSGSQTSFRRREGDWRPFQVVSWAWHTAGLGENF